MVELDKIVAAHVEHAKTSGLLRFYLLLEVDEPAAYITARELAEGDLKDDAGSLYRIVRTITDPNPRLKGPDYDAALAVATRACELTKFEDPFQLGVLAEAHFGMGNVVKAIEIQQLAINQLTQQPNAPEGNVIYLSDRLEAFKKAQQSK